MKSQEVDFLAFFIPITSDCESEKINDIENDIHFIQNYLITKNGQRILGYYFPTSCFVVSDKFPTASILRLST